MENQSGLFRLDLAARLSLHPQLPPTPTLPFSTSSRRGHRTWGVGKAEGSASSSGAANQVAFQEIRAEKMAVLGAWGGCG